MATNPEPTISNDDIRRGAKAIERRSGGGGTLTAAGQADAVLRACLPALYERWRAELPADREANDGDR